MWRECGLGTLMSRRVGVREPVAGAGSGFPCCALCCSRHICYMCALLACWHGVACVCAERAHFSTTEVANRIALLLSHIRITTSRPVHRAAQSDMAPGVQSV